jgi:hypothetical protein
MFSKMKTRKITLALGLLLSFGLSNCKKDPVEAPIVYNFDDKFKDIKVADLKQTTPATVTTTKGDVKTSEAATAASAAILSGGTTPALTSATTAIQAIVTTDQATALNTALASGATLTAAQQTQLASLKANSSVAVFFPALVLPTVNGVNVSGRVAAVPVMPKLVDTQDMFLGISDQCTDAAAAALATAKAPLDAAKASQEATVNASFTAAETAANTTATADLAALTTSIAAKKAALNTFFDPQINAATGFTKLLLLVAKTSSFGVVDFLEIAEKAAINEAKNARIKAATDAKNTDLAAVATAYNTALNAAKKIATDAANSCHNQGGGI